MPPLSELNRNTRGAPPPDIRSNGDEPSEAALGAPRRMDAPDLHGQYCHAGNHRPERQAIDDSRRTNAATARRAEHIPEIAKVRP